MLARLPMLTRSVKRSEASGETVASGLISGACSAPTCSLPTVEATARSAARSRRSSRPSIRSPASALRIWLTAENLPAGMMRPVRRRLLEWIDLPERRFAVYSRLRTPWRRLRFGAYGRGVTLVRPKILKGGHKIAIGDGCVIYPDASLSVEKRAWGLPGPRL